MTKTPIYRLVYRLRDLQSLHCKLLHCLFVTERPAPCSCHLSFHKSSSPLSHLLSGLPNSSNSSIFSSSFTPCLSLMPLSPLHSFKKCISVSSVSWSRNRHTNPPSWHFRFQFTFKVLVLHLKKTTGLKLFEYKSSYLTLNKTSHSKHYY